jgi:myo-inositol 2-dehydrogenase/D-chiro-inositol 1-dehydrogenase
MKVGVAGIGIMGRLHAELLAGLLRPGSLVLTDVDGDRAATLAGHLGARSVPPDRFLAEADAVVIATPPEHHAALLDAAVDAGIPALCEKPLGFDLAETLRLAERVERAGATVQIGFQRHFDAGFAAARRLVADGALGRLHLLRLAAHDPRPAAPPAVDEDMDAAPLFRDSSIHDFDLARWLSGDEIVEVHADGSDRGGGRRPANPSLLETAVVTMRLSGGGMAVLDATLLDPRGYDVRAELVGERESVVVGLTPRSPQRALDPEASPQGVPWPGYLERFRDAYRHELEAFLAVARGEAASPVTVHDAAEAMRTAVAASRSFAEGRRVRLDEIPALSAPARAGVA